MKFTTLIPTRLNDGSEVPESKLKEIIDGLATEFGGCSDEGLTKGQWIDPQDSSLYRDECRRVSVVCDRVFLDEAREAVLRIGKLLRQRVMYFEVRDYDGVQILEIPAE
jgi:hypothetical protein